MNGSNSAASHAAAADARAPRLLLLNGPNMDMLGIREPTLYGTRSLAELEAEVCAYAAARGAAVTCRQSNCEGVLIDMLHEAHAAFDGVVCNPAAYAHYSVALRDAIAAIAPPVVEVHLTNIAEREDFRRVSVTGPACAAVVSGKGIAGYFEAVDILLREMGEGK